MNISSTQPTQWSDETEFTNFILTIMEAAAMAFKTASKNAKRNNAPYGRIFSSTVGDLDTRAGQDALSITQKTYRWTEGFYDRDIDDVKEIIKIGSENGIVYIEYSYKQLGEGEEWFNESCRLLGNNPLKIKRELLLQRMRGSSNSPFQPEDLEIIKEKQGKIIEEVFINKLFRLDIYKPLVKDRIYFICVDVSKGYGQDNSAVVIMDPYELKPVAEFESPYIGVTQLKNFLYTLVKKYLPRSILIIERNENGEAILDGLRYSDIMHNLYYDSDKDLIGSHIDDKMDSQGFLKQEALRRKLYGVWTGTKSRQVMFSLLETHIADYKDNFICANIINDLFKLVMKKNGKIEAESGFHDDSIMAYLMGLYVYYHGNNLHYFGFVKGELPDEENRNKGLMSYEEIMEQIPDEDRQFFDESFGTKTIDDYQRHIMEEFKRVRQEQSNMMKVSGMIKPTTYAEEYEDNENEIPLDFFDELNS